MLVASTSGLASRLTHPVAVSASCIPRTRSSLLHWPRALLGRLLTGRATLLGAPLLGALHMGCAAGFVAREACSPQTTFYPCRRRGRQAPNPICALRRLEKHSGARPPLQHGSPGEPGSTTSRAHQHTVQPCYERHAKRSQLSGLYHQRGCGPPPLSTRRLRFQDGPLWEDSCL
jgi:hypothetical protein